MQDEQRHDRDFNQEDKDGYPDKKIPIVVNGREKRVDDENVAFSQVVSLAFPDPPTGEFICFTVTYRGAGGRKPEGSLVDDQSVKVKEGTIFNVVVTDKS